MIDGDLKITHGKLTEEIEKIFADPAAFKIKARADNLESCYSPIFMSGGRYDLKASATSDDANLHQGTIVIELGARYKVWNGDHGMRLLARSRVGHIGRVCVHHI